MIGAASDSDWTSSQAWRALDAQLRPFVARRVRSPSDIDDVLQDIFLKVQRGLPSLQSDQRFGSWVYQVARNVVTDHLRAAGRPVPDAREVHPAGPDAAEREQRRVEREVAAYATLFVSMLPSPYREALTLTELEGLSQVEASKRVGVSVSTMKSRVQRGRQKLKAALEDCCEIALDARSRVIECEPRPDGKLPDGCCD